MTNMNVAPHPMDELRETLLMTEFEYKLHDVYGGIGCYAVTSAREDPEPLPMNLELGEN